jgi:hypothetical protein
LAPEPLFAARMDKHCIVHASRFFVKLLTSSSSSLTFYVREERTNKNKQVVVFRVDRFTIETNRQTIKQSSNFSEPPVAAAFTKSQGNNLHFFQIGSSPVAPRYHVLGWSPSCVLFALRLLFLHSSFRIVYALLCRQLSFLSDLSVWSPQESSQRERGYLFTLSLSQALVSTTEKYNRFVAQYLNPNVERRASLGDLHYFRDTRCRCKP